MNDSIQASGTSSGVRAESDFEKGRLRKIAKSQRIILFFILMYIPLLLMLFALMASKWSFVLIIVLCLFVFTYILYSYIHLLKLAYEVGGMVTAVFCGILFWLFPPIGFLLLLFINWKASTMLKKAGYKVGLLGVNPNEIQ